MMDAIIGPILGGALVLAPAWIAVILSLYKSRTTNNHHHQE